MLEWDLKDTFYYVCCAGSTPKYELKTRGREGSSRALHSTEPPMQSVMESTVWLKRPDSNVHNSPVSNSEFSYA